jgi:hypothetical protein
LFTKDKQTREDLEVEGKKSFLTLEESSLSHIRIIIIKKRGRCTLCYSPDTIRTKKEEKNSECSMHSRKNSY